MKGSIDLVVFDMAGTTVRDDGDLVARALAGAMMAVLDIAPELRHVRSVMGMPKLDAIFALSERYRPGVEARDIERCHRHFVSSIVRHYRTAAGVMEIPGTRETFRTLRTRGIAVALDTGFPRSIVDAILERLGWQYGIDIDATVASDEVRRGRPNPDSILRAMELTGVGDPRQVVKVGDTPVDLKAGTAAGCGLVIGVGSGAYRLDELARFPNDKLVPDVRSVPEVIEAYLRRGELVSATNEA